MHERAFRLLFAIELQRKMRNFALVKTSVRTFHTALAVTLLLLLSLFPHHHHDGGAVCVVKEVCALDGQSNDCHTGHDVRHQHDSHYCFWQQHHRTASVQRLAWGDGLNWAFLPFEGIGVPLPRVVDSGGIRRPMGMSSCGLSLWGRLPVRRGPPALLLV